MSVEVTKRCQCGAIIGAAGHGFIEGGDPCPELTPEQTREALKRYHDAYLECSSRKQKKENAWLRHYNTEKGKVAILKAENNKLRKKLYPGKC